MKGGEVENNSDALLSIANYVADYGIGIDCHSRFIQVCVLTRLDNTISRWERSYQTTWEGLCEARVEILAYLHRTLEVRAPSESTLTYCIESTAAYHYPVMLCFGGYPCVVNPLLAHAGRRKTDRLDARALAHQAITGTWRPSYTADAQLESIRLILNHRRRLVKERTKLTNSMNNMVLRFGHTFAAHCSNGAMRVSSGLQGDIAMPIFEALSQGKLPNRTGISPIVIPEAVRPCMVEIIERVKKLRKGVQNTGNRLLRQVEKSEFVCKGGELFNGADVIKRLRTIPGVGPLLSCTWLAQVGDATRFQRANQVAAFCGFDPSVMISAGKVTSHTRRKGSKFLHYMIKQGARGLITRAVEPLGMWGQQISKRHRKGGFNKAVGAVGRRMAVALWICHRDQVDFDYEKYDFWRPPDVPDVELSEVGFTPQVLRILVDAGYAKTGALVASFAKGELAQKKGVGCKCLGQLNAWISRNRKSRGRDCSSADKSSGEASASSEPITSRSSPTASCSKTGRSTSTTGGRKATSMSANTSK